MKKNGSPKEEKENNYSYKSTKRPKEETGKEKWDRIKNEMDNKGKKRWFGWQKNGSVTEK